MINASELEAAKAIAKRRTYCHLCHQYFDGEHRRPRLRRMRGIMFRMPLEYVRCG